MYSLQTEPKASFTPNGLTRSGVQLTNGKLGRWVTGVARLRVAVSVAAATEVRNRGSVLGVLDELVIAENRAERHLLDGMTALVIQSMNGLSALERTRLPQNADGTVPIGTYLLEESFRLFFAWPFGAKPEETSFVERDMRMQFELLAKTPANLADGIITPGPATVVIDQFSIDVFQDYSVASTVTAPYFLPTITQRVLNVNGPLNKEPFYLNLTNPLRGLIISQRVDGYGEVNDIITQLTLRGANKVIIGDSPASWNDLVIQAGYNFGGEINAPGHRAHLPISFMQNGMLSKRLEPAEYTNFRLEIWGAKSAKGGAGQNMVRVTLLELESIHGVTAPVNF